VGAAFYDRANVPSGAISVSSLKSGRSEAELHRLGEIVRAHAAQLSKELGASVRG
jgi:IclR family acetate operon transcriptional repressor